MRIFWVLPLLFISGSSYAQDALARVLSDSNVTWAAISEVNIDLEEEKVYAEQFLDGDHHWFSTMKVDLLRYPHFPPDQFFSHLLAEHLIAGRLKLYSWETQEALDFPELRQQLGRKDTVFHADGTAFKVYRSLLPVDQLFDYFILKQLWYYHRASGTLHHKILGITPVHILTDDAGGKEPVHRRLGWIPFSPEEKGRSEMNDPSLHWIAKTTTVAFFSDWEVLKGQTREFVGEYFFTLPAKGLIKATPSGPDIPLRPPLTEKYLEMTRDGRRTVLYPNSGTQEDIAYWIDPSTPAEWKEVAGITFDQYLFFDGQATQMGSYLDMVGPLRRCYYEGADPWDYFYCPIYFILDPTQNGR